MATLKRRRERDLPKNRPDGLYDPNKRVLLSYDSDDQNVETATATGINHAEPDHSKSTKSTTARLGTSSLEEGAIVDTTARSEPSRNGRRAGASNEKYEGQKPMLGAGGLDSGNQDWDDQYAAESVDALAYLNAVRSEREAIPEILSAPNLQSFDEDDEYDPHMEDNYDYDHEVNGMDSEDVSSPVLSDSTCAAQAAYTQSLLSRFDALHRSIDVTPQPKLSRRPEKSHLVKIDLTSQRSCLAWKRLISRSPPTIVELRVMTPATARQVLELMQSSHLRPGMPITPNVGIWAMSLLARLEEYPRMHMEKLGDVRDLAKHVVLLKHALQGNEEALAMLAPDVDDAASTRSSSPDDDVVQEHDSTSGFMVIDMILAIVGERFGQRDFLSERPWPMPDATKVDP